MNDFAVNQTMDLIDNLMPDDMGRCLVHIAPMVPLEISTDESA